MTETMKDDGSFRREERGSIPTEQTEGPVVGKWDGDPDVLEPGWEIEVLASDPRPARVINGYQQTRLRGATACWIRCNAYGDDHPVYRSCDLSDLDLSDEDFDRLSSLPPEKP